MAADNTLSILMGERASWKQPLSDPTVRSQMKTDDWMQANKRALFMQPAGLQATAWITPESIQTLQSRCDRVGADFLDSKEKDQWAGMMALRYGVEECLRDESSLPLCQRSSCQTMMLGAAIIIISALVVAVVCYLFQYYGQNQCDEICPPCIPGMKA